jgi:hypothetical protein
MIQGNRKQFHPWPEKKVTAGLCPPLAAGFDTSPSGSFFSKLSGGLKKSLPLSRPPVNFFPEGTMLISWSFIERLFRHLLYF